MRKRIYYKKCFSYESSHELSFITKKDNIYKGIDNGW